MKKILFVFVMLSVVPAIGVSAPRLTAVRDAQAFMPPDTQVVKVVGDRLYIGTKYDAGNDLLIVFSKCMYNRLMTFSQVGLARNRGAMPMDNPDRAMDVVLNSAYSDNIGPLCIHGGGWCGANHSWREQNTTHTAENVSFAFFADGKPIRNGDALRAERVEVRARNRIFNPTVAPAENNAPILPSELCVEEVTYTVERGNIFVSLRHTYTTETPQKVATYYGMQSMFANESEIITPMDSDFDFRDVRQVAELKKKDAPRFNRFVERDVHRNYQSACLLPEGLGTHSLLSDDDAIFVHAIYGADGKCYHRLMADTNVKKGDVFGWSGLYTWFTPVVDDGELLVYLGYMNRETILFVDAKKKVKERHIVLPAALKGKKCRILQKGAGMDVGKKVKLKGMKISAGKAGSAVLAF